MIDTAKYRTSNPGNYGRIDLGHNTDGYLFLRSDLPHYIRTTADGWTHRYQVRSWKAPTWGHIIAEAHTATGAIRKARRRIARQRRIVFGDR